MSLAFSFVDLLVVLVVLGSMAYAIWRGFVSETLSIVAWAAAAFAALYLGPWVGRMAHSLITTQWLATVVGYAAAFLVVFIPLSFASYRFAESIRQSPVGPIDRVLGGTFGIVRGLAILGFAYLIFTAFVPILNQPRWLKEARTLPLIQSSAQVLLSIVPRHDGAPGATPAPEPKVTREAPHPAATPVREVRAKSAKHGKKGYGVGERRALDRLFEAAGNGGSKP
ncbi:MAG TPA: CvpA family protein [Rhizomicrobium sp.]|nr:CvpA family protein [Rhizomicrobium sp.]